MQWLRRMALLSAILSMMAGCLLPPDPAYNVERQPDPGRERYEPPHRVTRHPRDTDRDDRTSDDCLAAHRFRILDLDMEPDPVHEGQPINTWMITIRSNHEDDCATLLTVYDRDELAGRSHRLRIQPGTAVYAVPAVPIYRFHRQDACFNVQANVGGSWTPIEAQRTFCMHSRSGRRWSLRER